MRPLRDLVEYTRQHRCAIYVFGVGLLSLVLELTGTSIR